MLGYGGHCGDLHERIVHGHLSATFNSGRGGVLVNIVDAHNIGQEYAVEEALFKDLCQVGPVFDGVVLGSPGAGVAPEVEALVTHTGHVECVNCDALLLLSHLRSFRECSGVPAPRAPPPL